MNICSTPLNIHSTPLNIKTLQRKEKKFKPPNFSAAFSIKYASRHREAYHQDVASLPPAATWAATARTSATAWAAAATCVGREADIGATAD